VGSGEAGVVGRRGVAVTARAGRRRQAVAGIGICGRVEVDAVVSANLGAIRRRRGWTQDEVAERLAQFIGRLLPKASISAMERGFLRGRVRRFDAHQLYLLAVVFDVPIAYFFVPPPGSQTAELAGTGRPLVDLLASILGTDDQLVAFDDRLGEATVANPKAGEAEPGDGAGPGAGWVEEFGRWRHKRMVELAGGDRLGEIAAALTAAAAELTALGLAHLNGGTKREAAVSPPTTTLSCPCSMSGGGT